MTDLTSDTSFEAHAARSAYVDWPAIFAGFAIAAAISVVFTAFGSAVGLSAVSPFQGQGASARAVAIATALYAVWIAASAFASGGYVAGRMRRRVSSAATHETEVRDGAHGLVVWALGALLFSYLAASSAAGLASGGVATGERAAETLTSVYSDRLMRPVAGAPVAAGAETAGRQLGMILERSVASGALSDEDKAYAAQIVAANTGVPAADASKKIDAAFVDARLAADRARRAGVLVAFLTAAIMAVGAAAAWWGAGMGGRHRDESADFSHLTRW